jgi:hypothetical protein
MWKEWIAVEEKWITLGDGVVLIENLQQFIERLYEEL